MRGFYLGGKWEEVVTRSFINSSLPTVKFICFQLLDFCYMFSFVVIHLKNILVILDLLGNRKLETNLFLSVNRKDILNVKNGFSSFVHCI